MAERFRRGKRSRLYWAMVAVLAILLGILGLLELSRARCLVLAGEVTCRVETSAKMVALSLDDSPSEAGVDYVLDVLGRENVRATFFLVGNEMERRPNLAPRLLRAGHELGNHS